MKFYLYTFLFSYSFVYAQDSSIVLLPDYVPSIKIRKAALAPPSFAAALSLPSTATSCDCFQARASKETTQRQKLGCLHPDTASVCRVVVTEFSAVVIHPSGDVQLFEEIQGSFLSERLSEVVENAEDPVFVSYFGIKGQTADGTTVVVPSFGTTAPYQRGNRAYVSVYDYLPELSPKHTQINSFELLAYSSSNQLLFRQRYESDTFDKHTVRPDAARYVFKSIEAVHESGTQLDIPTLILNSIDTPTASLVSNNN